MPRKKQNEYLTSAPAAEVIESSYYSSVASTEPESEADVERRSQGQWNAYLMGAGTREERNIRLGQVPEQYRAIAKRHVETWFAIRSYHKCKQS